jgi:hypothetical protein
MHLYEKWSKYAFANAQMQMHNYPKPSYNEHLVTTNRFTWQIGYISTQTNPAIMNPGYKEQKWPVPAVRYIRV